MPGTPSLKTSALSFLFAITFTSAYSQSEKEIVSRLRTALKKTSAHEQVSFASVKGTYKMNDVEATGGFYYKRPRLLRGEIHLPGNFAFIHVGNDSIKWGYSSTNKSHTITKYKPLESQDENDAFEFAKYDLLHYKELRHKLTFVKKLKMDSVEVYELDLVMTDRIEARRNIKFFINTKSNLVYKVADRRGTRCYANYTVHDGYVYPMHMVQIEGEMSITGIFKEFSFNHPLPDSLFEIPAEAYAYRAALSARYKAVMLRGDSLYAAGDYKRAVQTYTDVMALDEADFKPYNSRGLAKIRLKDYYDAITDLNLAIRLDSTAPEPKNNRGLAKFYLGDLKGAIADYEEALALEPGMIIAYKNKGMALLHQQKYEEAAYDFRAAIGIDGSDGESHFKLAVSLAQLKKYEEADRHYDSAVHRQYNSEELNNYRGVTQYMLKKYDSALVSFSKVLAMNSENLQSRENYIRTLYALEKFTQCEEECEKYLTRKPDHADIHNLKGLCRYNDENYKGAIQDISRAIELNAKSAVYYSNRALAKERIDDYEGAIADYSKSIALYPNDASVFYKRGLVKIHTSKKIEGCLDLGTANEMNYAPAKEAILKHCN